MTHVSKTVTCFCGHQGKLLYLTHWGQVTHICVGNLTIIGSDNGPSHFMNQCWNIVNWTLRNKLQWNLNRNSNIFIQENALENVVCEMASILPRPQCVLDYWFSNKSLLFEIEKEIQIKIKYHLWIMHLLISFQTFLRICPLNIIL